MKVKISGSIEVVKEEKPEVDITKCRVVATSVLFTRVDVSE